MRIKSGKQGVRMYKTTKQYTSQSLTVQCSTCYKDLQLEYKADLVVCEECESVTKVG